MNLKKFVGKTDVPRRLRPAFKQFARQRARIEARKTAKRRRNRLAVARSLVQDELVRLRAEAAGSARP